MQTIKSILTSKTPEKIVADKYLTRNFQALGLRLAEELGDLSHKSLYIKLAKTLDQKILEDARAFVIDSKARNRGALFMWKLKQIKQGKKTVHES